MRLLRACHEIRQIPRDGPSQSVLLLSEPLVLGSLFGGKPLVGVGAKEAADEVLCSD
jgi:hypothetical protein